MSTPIISANVAQCLNQKVQQLIDPRLFLCCNYEPTFSCAISEEGQYFTAIQDLYKFALDSSCVIKCYNKFLRSKEEEVQFKELRGILHCINLLRSVIDHNQSELNGRFAKQRLEDYSIWLQNCLGKDVAELPEDFLTLHQQLHKMAKQLLAYIDQFIEHLGHLPDKSDITDQWINYTLQWYCSNTKTEIYKGQLMDTYIANTNANGKSYQDLYRPQVLHRKISSWIEAAIFYSIDQELEEIEEKIQSSQAALSEDNYIVQKLRVKMTDEQFEIFQASARSNLEENVYKKTSLLGKKQELEKEVGNRPIDYLFKNLERQLRDTMAKLEAEGVPYTLLPQDLMQENIDLYFGSVHSPEEDF